MTIITFGKEMYDKKRSLDNFTKILGFKTVSDCGNQNEFENLLAVLPEIYPHISKICGYERFNGNSIMYRWKGKNSDGGILLAAHYDVVPADGRQWTHSPFSGTVSDGKIWSRGTVDTKCTFCGILESADALAARGFVPENDIYLCFGGDEETSGFGAAEMAEELLNRGVRPYLVLDEGGAVVNGKSVGINSLCALVGIAEKGYMDIEFITRGTGGHSSVPGAHTPVSEMIKVLTRLTGNRMWKSRMNPPLKIMIDSAVKYMPLKYRILLKNFWFWGRLFRKKFEKILPEIVPLTSTVGSVTQIFGGSAENVISEKIRAVGNFRIINGSSTEETLDIIKKNLDGLDVEINVLCALEPSKVSPENGKGWDILKSAISEFWKDSILLPYLMLARSDSRSYGIISDNIYRFSPVMMTKSERNSIHGIDENISVESFYKIIDFYIFLITHMGNSNFHA